MTEEIRKEIKIAVHDIATANFVNLLTMKALITNAKKGSNAIGAT